MTTRVEAFREFVQSRRRAGRSPRTIEWYLECLHRLVVAGEHLPIPRGELESWLDSAPSSGTARGWLRAARAWLTWCDDRYGIPSEGRRVQMPQLARRMPRVLTTGELRALFDACETPRDRLLVGLLLDTGIRIGELATLRTERLEQDAQGSWWAMVDGKTGQRWVPLSPETIGLMSAANRGARGDGSVVRTLHRERGLQVTSAKYRVRTLMERGGLKAPQIGPHVLRHTFATLYLRHGGDVHRLQRILGHTTLAMTLVYVHLSREDLGEEHRRVSPLRLVTGPRQFEFEKRGEFDGGDHGVQDGWGRRRGAAR